MSDTALQIYLPDNPIELTKLAFNVLGQFEETLETMDTNFILTTENGYTPSLQSLAAAVIWSEYETIEMFECSKSNNGGYIATKLNEHNSYYDSHVLFLNAFVNDNTHDMMNFLMPRCIVNIELMPSEYYIGATTSVNGYTEKEFSHSDLLESIQEYLYYYLRGMNRETQSGLDGLIAKLVWFEQFAEKYLLYVPSELE